MTLTPLYLLASVVAPLFAAHRGALYRLGIYHAGARLGISFGAHSQAFSEGPIDTLPGAVHAPSPEVVVDGWPPGEVVGQEPPLATALQEVEDGIEDLAKTVSPRPSISLGGGHVGLYVVPFGVG